MFIIIIGSISKNLYLAITAYTLFYLTPQEPCLPLTYKFTGENTEDVPCSKPQPQHGQAEATLLSTSRTRPAVGSSAKWKHEAPCSKVIKNVKTKATED